MATPPKLRYMPALDGLRAVAVVGVIAFHANLLQGGFLGVDLFFVLSGFLITSLLLAETAIRGRVNLGRFWARRAARLLPPLLLVLLAVAVYAATLAAPTELTRIRGDGIATLLYYVNWHAIFSEQSYWDLFSVPSPLAHCWSLAIEEQFYLLWPLVISGIWWLDRKRSLTTLAWLCLLGTLGSWLLMAALYTSDIGSSRVYWGTDTRASALLLGAGAAALRARPGPTVVRLPNAAAGVAVVVLAIAWWGLSGHAKLLYWGGFAVCQLAVVTLLWVTSRTTTNIWTRALSWSPLRYVGKISYGLYLWHWPVFVIVSEARSGTDGARLRCLQLALSFALASGCYHAIEQPIRKHLGGRAALPLAAGAMLAVLGVFLVVTQPHQRNVTRARSWLPQQAAERPTLSLLIAGDSVAARIAVGLQPLQQSLALTIAAGATSGCGLIHRNAMLRLPDGKKVRPGAHCRPLSERWRSFASHDVALYLIGAPSLGDYHIDGAWQHPCQPAFDAYFSARATEAIDALAARAALIHLATMPNITSQEYTHEQDRRTQCLNRSIRQAVASRPRAKLIDLANYVCPQGQCRARIHQVLLRHDGQHFEGEGAELIGWWLTQQIRHHAEPTSR